MEGIIGMCKHRTIILNGRKVKIVVPLAPWARALPPVSWMLPGISVRVCAVNKSLHANSADCIEEVACADTRWSAGFRHASTEAASATAVAIIHARGRVVRIG